MSKSKNYPDVNEVFDRDGSDAMRWFLMASPILRGGNLIVTEQGIREGVRQALLPLWNTWCFLPLYAGRRPGRCERTDSPHVLDRYILAKMADARRRRHRGDGGLRHRRRLRPRPRPLRDAHQLVCAALARRFWAGDADAIDTLHTVLEVTARVAAPLLPLIIGADVAGPDRRPVGAPDGLAARRTNCLTTTALVERHGRGSRRCAPRCCRCARPSKLRVRLPLAEVTVAAPTRASAAVRRHHRATRSTSRRSI